jgi:hypothetical protein
MELNTAISKGNIKKEKPKKLTYEPANNETEAWTQDTP